MTATRPVPDGGAAPAKPDARTLTNLWQLGATPETLRTLAGKWTTLHGDFTGERSTFAAQVSSTMPHWQADNGDDFTASYSGAQANGLSDMAEACTSVAKALTTLAEGLDGVQGRLDSSFGRLTSAMPHENIGLFGVDPLIVFHPEDDHDDALINTELKTAEALVQDAKDLVADCNTTLGKIPEGFTAIRTGWKGEADGSSHRWTKHPTGSSSYRTVQTINGTTIVSGNNTDEHVRVEIDPKTGETVLVFSRISQRDADPEPGLEHEDMRWVYTEEQRIRVPAGQEVVLNTGDGNDQVEVPKGVNVKLRVLLGTGDDRLNAREADDRIEGFGGTGADRITTGHGADLVSGGEGADYQEGGASADQIFGGSGNDSSYGLDGNDLVSGGDGIDFIDGGSDDDIAFGGADNDVIGGGRDDDSMYGGSGDDHVYGGHGTDFADGGVTAGSNGVPECDDDQLTLGSEDSSRQSEQDRVVTVEYDGSQGGFIQVEGSPEFQARVNSDLEFMRSTPTGQQMLKKLTELHEGEENHWWPGDQKKPYIIREYDTSKVADNATESEADDRHTVTYRPEWATMNGDPTGDYHETPPLVVLYHEMGHSYQFMSGTEAHGRTKQGNDNVNSVERQNVGLSWSENDRGGDDEGLAPDHEEDPDQHVYRENGMRDELGVDRRTRY